MTTTSDPFAGRLRTADCRVADLRALLDRQVDALPAHAERVERQVPVYAATALREAISSETGAAEVEAGAGAAEGVAAGAVAAGRLAGAAGAGAACVT